MIRFLQGALILALGAAVAQGCSNEPTAPVVETGAVAGQIVGLEGESGAQVSLNRGETRVATQPLDARGAFRFTRVEPGTYEVRLETEAEMHALFMGSPSRTVSVIAGEDTQFTMQVAPLGDDSVGAVVFRAADDQKRPAVGVGVFVMESDAATDELTVGESGALTGNDGLAMVPVPAGEYGVSAVAPRGFRIVDMVPLRVTVEGESRTEVRILVEPRGTGDTGIARIQVFGDEAPLAGARVFLFPEEADVFQEELLLETGDDGLAAFTVPEGRYFWSVEAPEGWLNPMDVLEWIEVVAGEPVERSVSLIKLPAPNVFVSVKDETGAGVEGIRIAFNPEDREDDDTNPDGTTSGDIFPWWGEVYTNVDGVGSAALVPGRYTPIVHAPYQYEILSVDPASFSLTGDGRIDIAVTLRMRDEIPMGTLLVTVLNRGEVVSGAEVLVQGLETGLTETQGTDEEGQARFELAPGLYMVFAVGPDGDVSSPDQIVIAVAPEETVELTLELGRIDPPPFDSVVEVHATMEGEPVPWAEIRLFRTDDPDLAGGCDFFLHTDESGNARAEVPAGSYRVEVPNRFLETAASVTPATFDVGPDETVAVDVVFEPRTDTGEARIMVLADGDPAANVSVQLYPGGDWGIPEAGVDIDGYLVQGITGSDGTVTFNLPQGEYVVEVWVPGMRLDDDQDLSLMVVADELTEKTVRFRSPDPNAPGVLGVMAFGPEEELSLGVRVLQDGVVVEEGSTQDFGEPFIVELRAGSYELEVLPPEGYAVIPMTDPAGVSQERFRFEMAPEGSVWFEFFLVPEEDIPPGSDDRP